MLIVVQLVHSVTPWLKHARLPCPSSSPHLLKFAQTHVHWVGDAIQPSHPLLFPSLPASILPVIWVFPNEPALCISGQSLGASASASVLPMNIQGWFSSGLTGLISLLSKKLSKVFSSTMVRRHQFFGTQPSLFSSSHTCTWLLEKNHSFDYTDLCQQSDVSAFLICCLGW